jgi:hypothetical protein
MESRKAALAAKRPVPPPPEDRSKEGSTVNEHAWLIIGGDKMRYEADLVRWPAAGSGFITKHYAAAWNGRDSKLLFSMDRELEYPSGAVMKEQGHTDAAMVYLRPLMLWCRPLDPLLGALLGEQLELRAALPPGSGPDGVLVRHPAANGGRHEIYVDPARSYVPTRLANYDSQNVLRIQSAIQYRHDAQHGWLPSEWDVSCLDKDGLVLESVKARVEDIAINVNPPPEEFEINFPPGTWVNDAKRSKSYIVRASGGKREVLMAERVRGATYADLVASDSGRALERGTSHWTAVLIGLIGACGLFVVVRILLRRRLRNQP